MLKFNATLAAARLAATNKKDRSQAIVNALGSTRRLRIYHDPAGGADPVATGTEIYNVGMTGAMSIVGGNITYFGVAGNVTVKVLAHDLAVGTAVLRIEGGGNYVEGTLGLAGSATSGRDFVLPANITANTSVTFSSSARITAPLLYPSGTGPAVPSLVNSRPKTVEIWNWSNATTPVLAGTITFDTRLSDFVYEDTELAASTGDVAVFQSSVAATLGSVEFGATLFVANQSNTMVGNVPLYQVLVHQTFKSTWTTYPQSDTMNLNTQDPAPLPFKAILKDVDGNVLYTWQMQDGKPINDPSLSQAQTASVPLRPFYNTAMMLPWQNTRPRMSDKALKYFPGVDATELRPTTGRAYLAVRNVDVLITGFSDSSGKNGLNHMFAQDQWPRPYAAWTPTTTDPYVQYSEQFNRSGASSEYAHTTQGWGYEPGSYAGHTWHTGPGGVRFDRGYIPSQLVMWVQDPTGNRPQGATPWRDIADAFMFGYFNHSNHWISDAKTMILCPNSEMLSHGWHLSGNYYGDTDNTGKKVIAMNSTARNGKYAFNGWLRDWLHSYANCGWGALLLNSPMHAIGQKFDFFNQIMLDNVSRASHPGGNGIRDAFMTRQMVWTFLSHTIQWKLAANHPLGVTRAEVEASLASYLALIYDYIYVPVMGIGQTQEVSLFADSLRNLGTPYVTKTDNVTQYPQGGNMVFYIAGVMALMKQTGFWSVMKAKGGKTTTIMNWLVDRLDKYCFDLVLDTPWASTNYQNVYLPQAVPTSWASYATNVEPFNGQLGPFTNADGTRYVDGDRDSAQHLVPQYIRVRQDYFPEYTHARLAAARTKVDGYYATITSFVTAASTNNNKTNADHPHRLPSYIPLKAPATGDLGPA